MLLRMHRSGARLRYTHMVPYRTPGDESKGVPAASVPSAPPRYQPSTLATVRLRVMTPLLPLFAGFGLGLVFAGEPTLALSLMGAGLVAGLALSLRTKARARRAAALFEDQNSLGLARLAVHDYDDALRIFERLVDEAKPYPINHSVFVLNCAVAYLHRCEFDRALSLMDAAHRGRWLENAKYRSQRVTLLRQMAMALALKGDLDAADRYHALAGQTITANQVGVLLASQAVVAMRRGDYAGGLAKMEANWKEAEAVLPAAQMKILRLLRAMAVTHVDEAGTRTAEVGALVDGTKPLEPAEIAHFARAWREFREFAVERGLITDA
jgi:hypothetical protein